jgi:hypothetical protein
MVRRTHASFHGILREEPEQFLFPISAGSETNGEAL